MTIIDFNHAKSQFELDQRQKSLTAEDIRTRLHSNPRAFLDWLFSKRVFYTQHNARLGSTKGEAGNSLSIQLTGPDAGLWKDFATGQGGDLIKLFTEYRGYTDPRMFPLALNEIARLHFNQQISEESPPQWFSYKPVTEQIEQHKHEYGTKPRDDMVELGAPVATFRYFDTHGNVTASVVRYEPDGTRENKTFRPYCFRTFDGRQKWAMGAPEIRPLYHLPEIALATEIVLTEGEGKCDAIRNLGIEATTAMQGAQAPIHKTDWSPIAGKQVTIWPDNDAPGLEYGAAVARHLTGLGCTVRLITPPAGKPEGWDAGDCVAEGGETHGIIKGAEPYTPPPILEQPPQPKPKIRLLTLADMENLAPPAWLIDGIITLNGLSMQWGRSGSMKSFVALDMALCVATGVPWHGRDVKAGRVVYLAAEGAHGLARRTLGWCRRDQHKDKQPNFQLIPHGLRLTSGDLDNLLEALCIENMPPNFIIIDTMSRTFGSGNPNQPAEMNAYVTAADKLRELTGAHVMVIHHGGKDEDKNELGNEGLRNASDTVIHVRRNRSNGLVELINEAPKGKQKDAEEFKTIKLLPVKVAYQLNNEECSTLVLRLDDSEPASNSDENQQSKKLGPNEVMILTLLRKLKRPTKFITIKAATGINDGSLSRALGSLTEKNLIEIVETDGNSKSWSAL